MVVCTDITKYAKYDHTPWINPKNMAGSSHATVEIVIKFVVFATNNYKIMGGTRYQG